MYAPGVCDVGQSIWRLNLKGNAAMRTRPLTCVGASVAAGVLLVGCGSVSTCTPKKQEFYDLASALMTCAVADPELTQFVLGFGVASDNESTRSTTKAPGNVARAGPPKAAGGYAQAWVSALIGLYRMMTPRT